MSGFTQENSFWSQQNDQPYQSNNFYQAEYNQFQNQNLDFKPLEDYGQQVYSPSFSPMPNMPYMDTKESVSDDFDEPPLLEELEIYPDRILEKIKVVLNPFRSHCLTDDAEYLTKDADLAGPIFFYLVLAVCLFLSGNKPHFGYVYGVTVLASLLMYGLLSLMTLEDGVFTFTTVFSVLGYSVSPIVGLSAIGIFFSLRGLVGIALSIIAVLWCCLSASRLFVTISGDKEQQPLIAYPCALVAGIYILMVVF
ncbi:protein YIPF7 [Harmonia axyridis]|uniref:protein YIPF7 n=1 Tax=Harmonia axyridis TaxID=115357 RepID=UPI001E27717A|nr:protein YIPF7 [Harmonia axyridis]